MSHARWSRDESIAQPGRVSPFVVRLARVLAPLLRLAHRPTLKGVEHLPASGSYLLVANHSAGVALAELVCFACEYLRRVGPDRPLAGFALPVGFRVFPLSRVLRAVGAIPSTYAAAERTLASGVPVLVFPGGDHEGLRPIWLAHQVDFAGRVGFLKIARAAGVPIVPMGIRGSAFTAPIVLRSRWLATLLVTPRIIGQKRWGLSVLGLLVALALALFAPVAWPLRAALVYLWLGSPLVFLPWVPWTLRFRVGAPLAPSELFSGAGDDAELRAALARTEAAVQALVRGEPSPPVK